MTSWQEASLGEVSDVLVGYAFKSSVFTSDPRDVRLLRGVNIGQGFVDWHRVAYWPTGGAGSPSYQLMEGDVVLAMDRPWIEAGLKRARVRGDDLPALLVQRVARLRGTSRIRTSLIHHLLATEGFSRYLQGIVTGATVPHISQSQIEAFVFRLPPLAVQDKICEILDSLDDLIGNSRRRVEVLEEMTLSIYREWFVHFRYPGHENEAFVESSLGLIPESWEVGRIDAHILLQRGFDLPLSQRESGTIPVMGASGRLGFHSRSKATAPGVITGRSGTVGIVTYVPRDYWPLNTTLWVKEFRLATPRSAYFLLASLDLKQMASGAAVPTLNRNHVHALPAICPPRSLIRDWDSYVLPLFESATWLSQQTERLAAVRDLLIPKLVTGQIDIAGLDLDTVAVT
jgi:type I restriction enzyme, S subunit